MMGAVKQLFRGLRLDIRRVPLWREYEWLRARNIRTVLDIGANIGQFAVFIHRLLPDARIYAFEPLADCCDQLVRRMRGVPGFRAFHMALGDSSAKVSIHRNEFSPSSSLLPMTSLHRQAFAFAQQTEVEQTDIRRLDEVMEGVEVLENVLMKVDVQGAEDKVLRGGKRTLARSSILILETAFRPLYVGQPLFDDIYDMVRSEGFALVGCEGIVRDSRDGSILQCDAVFARGDESHGQA